MEASAGGRLDMVPRNASAEQHYGKTIDLDYPSNCLWTYSQMKITASLNRIWTS